MSLVLLLSTFVVLTLGMALVYFYIFTRRKEMFIQYWGFSWLAYSISLLCLILSMGEEALSLLEVRKLFDMLNILFLLYGTYSFSKQRIPGYWNRFALYLTIWLSIGIYYNFDLMSVYLPISMFQIICTGVIIYTILRRWNVPKLEKVISITLFVLWGVGKAVLSIVEANNYILFTVYLIEILFSNMLNFSIFIIFMERALGELIKTQKNFKIIAENATDLIFFYAFKPNPTFDYVSPSAESVTGYSVQSFYSDPDFYRELVPPMEYERITKVFTPQEDMSTGRNSLVFQMLHKNGITFWAEMTSTAIYDKYGQQVAVEGIIRDINQMKSVESQLIASKESRDRLLSYISHELRIPVSSIMGYIEALKDGTYKNNKEKDEAMSIIYEKSSVLNHLIDDLFQLSKLETKQFSFNFTMMDALEVSNMLMDSNRADVIASGLKLKEIMSSANLAQKNVIVDPERINQVFRNLLSNAIKFTEEGRRITIRFEVNDKKSTYEISVADQGEGIDKDDIQKVFDRFFSRKKDKENYSSSGLGLTISKEIVESHNGELSVKSRVGEGSTFIVSIPLYFEKLEK